MKIRLFIVAFFLLMSSRLSAQYVPHVMVEGEIVRDGANLSDGLLLELRGINSLETAQRTEVIDGRFEIPNVAIGEYEVRIFNSRGKIVYQDDTRVSEAHAWLIIHLIDERKTQPPSSQPTVVSVQRLLHPIPAKAAAEFQRADEASRSGDVNKSMQHLQKALGIYPDYVEAHNNLGVAYMNLGQYDKAADEFRKAVALDPAADRAYSNLALSLSDLGRFEEAEVAVRKALQLAPNSIVTRYVLGRVLFAQNKNTPEMLDSFQKSVEQFPLAHLFLAQILVDRGSRVEAAAELQRYLETGKQERRTEVQGWLRLLTPSQKP
jgi:Tfp pilus assembly protein PilF